MADVTTHHVPTTIVMEPSGCWRLVNPRFLGAGPLAKPNPKGYVALRRGGKLSSGHRFFYEKWIGKVPEGLQLDHLCRNRACVNPTHLEPVTARENSERSPFFNGAKTHCPKGHPFAGDNLRVVMYRGRERRLCIECYRKTVREAQRRRRARLKAEVQACLA